MPPTEVQLFVPLAVKGSEAMITKKFWTVTILVARNRVRTRRAWSQAAIVLILLALVFIPSKVYPDALRVNLTSRNTELPGIAAVIPADGDNQGFTAASIKSRSAVGSVGLVELNGLRATNSVPVSSTPSSAKAFPAGLDQSVEPIGISLGASKAPADMKEIGPSSNPRSKMSREMANISPRGDHLNYLNKFKQNLADSVIRMAGMISYSDDYPPKVFLREQIQMLRKKIAEIEANPPLTQLEATTINYVDKLKHEMAKLEIKVIHMNVYNEDHPRTIRYKEQIAFFGKKIAEVEKSGFLEAEEVSREYETGRNESVFTLKHGDQDPESGLRARRSLRTSIEYK